MVSPEGASQRRATSHDGDGNPDAKRRRGQAPARPAQTLVPPRQEDPDCSLPQARQRGHAAPDLRGDEGPADRGRRGGDAPRARAVPPHQREEGGGLPDPARGRGDARRCPLADLERPCRLHRHVDRKSTRLNSSHVKISYAVFCLKKKKKKHKRLTCDINNQIMTTSY